MRALDVSAAPRRAAAIAAHPRAETAAAAVFSFITLVALTARTTLLTTSSPQFAKPYDHHKYIYMAEHNPLDFHIWPYCYRIVTPLLAKFLPFGLENNFFLIAFCSVWLSALLVFLICRHYKCSFLFAFIGMCLFLSTGLTTKLLLQDFWISDPLALGLVTLALYLAIRRQALAFAIVLLVGAGTRENVLLAAVFYYTLHATRLIDRRAFIQFCLVTLPSLVGYAALHLAIATRNSDPAYLRTLPYADRMVHNGNSKVDTAGVLIHRLVHNALSASYDVHTVRLAVTAVGLSLVLAAAIGAWRQPVLLVRYLPFLLLTYLQLYLWGTSRYIATMVPPFIVLAVGGLALLASRLSGERVLVLLVVPLAPLLANLLARSAENPSLRIQLLIAVLSALLIGALAVARAPHRGSQGA
jgi:hypothetical protein